jgi:hypothetical protein
VHHRRADYAYDLDAAKNRPEASDGVARHSSLRGAQRRSNPVFAL